MFLFICVGGSYYFIGIVSCGGARLRGRYQCDTNLIAKVTRRRILIFREDNDTTHEFVH